MTATEQKLSRELAVQRRRVDGLNQKILKLVQERGEIVLAIADLKRDLGLERFDPRREEDMLRVLLHQNEGPFDAAELREIFAALFRASLELQARRRRRPTRKPEGNK